MIWTTRSKLRIARAATVWLIRRHIDPEATFLLHKTDEKVLADEAAGATGFHVRGTRYPTPDADGRTAFGALVAEHRPDDPALVDLAKIVHDADRGTKEGAAPEAAGLLAITVSLPEVATDEEIIERSALIYDALYFTLQKRRRPDR